MACLRELGLSAAFAAAGFACAGNSGAFNCLDHAQCVASGVQGSCEPSGYCSFPDADCPSMQRYGERAPTEVAGQCTPVEDTGGLDSATAGSGSADGLPDPDGADAPGTTASVDGDGGSTGSVAPGSTGVGDTGSVATDPVATGTVGTGGVDTGTVGTGGVDTGTVGTSGSSSDGGATGPLPACVPFHVDDFEDGVLDPAWDTWVDTACWFEEQGGYLDLGIGAAAGGEWVDTGVYVGPGSLVGGHVRAELAAFDAPLGEVSVWLSAWDETGCELDIAVFDGEIIGYDQDAVLPTVPFVPDQPFWLQLRVDLDGVAHWEWSLDGQSWMLLHSEASPCDLENVRTAVFAGGEHANPTPIVRRVASFERCGPP